MAIINEFKHNMEISQNDQIFCKTLNADVLIKLGHFTKSLNITDHLILNLFEVREDFIKVDVYRINSEALLRVGKFDKSLEMINKGMNILNQIFLKDNPNHINQKAILLNLKGLILLEKGDIDESIDYFHNSILLCEKTNNKKIKSKSLNNLGIVNGQKGEIDQSLTYFLQSLELKKVFGTKQEIAFTFNNIGVIYRMKGDLNQSLDYHQQSLILSQEIGNKKDITRSLSNIGVVFDLKGELNKAYDYQFRCLELRKEIGNKKEIAISYNNIAELLRKKGEYNSAESLYHQSLTLYKEIGNLISLSDAQFNLILFLIESDSVDEAQIWLDKLENIKQKEKNKTVNYRYLIAKAVLLKSGIRAKQRGQAEIILEKIVIDNIADSELLVIALLNLCELLFYELRITNLEDVLFELKSHIKSLIDVANQQNSHWLLAEAYLLKSKVLLIDLNINESLQIIKQAEAITEKQELKKLNLIIKREKEQLINELAFWNELSNKNVSYAERLDLVNIDQILSLIKTKKYDIIANEINPENFNLETLAIGLSMGSLTDRGFMIQSKNRSCQIEDKFLVSMLEYSAVLFQGKDTSDLYGPFPHIMRNTTSQVFWYFMMYGFLVKDNSVTDTRVLKEGGLVTAIILIIYPKTYDLLFSVYKPEIQELVSSITSRISDIELLTDNSLNDLELELKKLISSKIET